MFCREMMCFCFRLLLGKVILIYNERERKNKVLFLFLL